MIHPPTPPAPLPQAPSGQEEGEGINNRPSSAASPSPVGRGPEGVGEPPGTPDVLSAETREAIVALKTKYPQVQSAILDALRLAQDEIGYLPPEATAAVAALLGVSPHHVHSLATFYTMFFTQPVGRAIVEVCDNLSCALWGSRRILARLEQEFGIAAGETTPDGAVTLLRTIECLAACGGAPALRVNTTYHEKMTEEKVMALVKELRGTT